MTCAHTLAGATRTYSKTHVVGSGSATEGHWASSGDTDFIVDVDKETGEEMVQIGDIKMQKNYMEYYSNHIAKLKSICGTLNAPARQANASSAAGGW